MRRSPSLGGPALVGCLAAILILCLGAWHVLHARRTALLDAEHNAINLSRSLSQHAARTIETADLVLSGVVNRIEGGAIADPARFKQFLEWRLTTVPQVLSIVVVDADGLWIADSIPTPHTPLNTGDRPYFAWHRDHDDRDTHFDPPIESRYSGRTFIPISQRWNRPDGRFGGVVFAAVLPDYFQNFYKDLGVGAEGSINLVSLQGRMLARHPVAAGVIGRDVSAGPLFRDLLPKARAGSFLSRSPIDGIERIAAYERVEKYPLLVLVGLGLEETLAPWRRNALLEGIVLSIAAFGLAGLGFGLERQQQRARAAEATVRQSEANYRLLAESASDVVTRRTVGGVRLYVSPACDEVFGYAPDEILKLPLADMVHPDDWPATQAFFDRLLAGAVGRGQIRHRLRHKDGRWIWIEANTRLVRDAAGTPVEFVTTARDIDERVAAETALREAKTEAEAARVEAERASEAKGEFLASMSHEIRTPLNGMLGYADLLLDEPAIGPAVRQHGERIRTAGLALLTVVNDILDFSKIEGGQIDLASEPFALSNLIDNAVSIVRAYALQKGLELRVDADAGLPRWVSGDEDRLRQVLLNLLNNAIKFTRTGAVGLDVRLIGSRDARARLRFAIKDTGIGIAQSKRHLLFERFSQIDGTIRREFGGTGLGLSISKRLVELMGGMIGVESEEGRGSTFWFEVDLPLVAPAEPASTISTEPIPAAPRRLLLVEDVPLNQELAQAVLSRAGHEVDVVSSGAQAILAVQAKAYDLVLMDVQMPGMDGTTATRLIRALDHSAASVPIVAMTANVLPHQVEAFRAAGMQDHVGKPFKRDALHAAIARWARKSDTITT